MKDDRVGDEELLVARSNKGYKKIHGRVWYVPENKEQDRSAGREVEVERGTRETMKASNSRFYHKVTGGSWERCDPSSLWQVVQDDVFCGNYKRDISRRVSKVV